MDWIQMKLCKNLYKLVHEHIFEKKKYYIALWKYQFISIDTLKKNKQYIYS